MFACFHRGRSTSMQSQKKLLQEQGWEPPVDDAIPTGRELLHEYLLPLSSANHSGEFTCQP